MRLALQCKTWDCLPDEIERQEHGLMERMTLVHNVYTAVRAANNAANIAEWAKANPEQMDIVRWVEGLRRDATDRDDSNPG